MIKLAASVYLLSESEGGMLKEGYSGMRPSFGFDGELITSEIVTRRTAETTIPRGERSTVAIHLPYGEIFGNAIRVGMNFTIQLGGKIIGRGTVDEILEVVREPRNEDILRGQA